MSSPALEIPVGSTISFWYHWFGSDLGSLKIVIEPCGDTGSNIWEINGTNTASADTWVSVTVDLPAQSLAKIHFVGVTGSGFSGDVALDDISLSLTYPPTRDLPSDAPSDSPSMSPS